MNIRTTRRLTAPVAIAAGLALTLTACGGGGGGGGTSSDDPDAAPSDDYTPGPLEKMWTEAYGDFNMDSADMNAQQNQMEQLVAECMSAEGWEYTPVDYSQMDNGGGIPIEPGAGGDDEGPQWGTEAYAKELGYGISTWEDMGSETAEPLPEVTGDSDDSEWFDPNQEYVESLSETARDQYYEALNGPQPTEEEMASGEWEYDPKNAGCYGKASDEVYNVGGNIWEDEKYKGLIDEMNLIYTQAENDPKITEVKAAWSACMADAGYPGLADSGAAQETIYSELNAFWEKGEEPTEEVLAPLREKEKAIATADFTCSKKADINKVQIEVQHKLEQEFIDSHKAELEELMATLKEQQEAAKG
ncbi:MAG: hypothetical protein M3Y20_06190 [Actinomycetota bacterium]|nr:hypothetical protein [Actinomycetota bacterium]